MYAGKVRRSVRVSWPLEFAGGFHSLLSGRDNVRFVARIYGQNVREVLDFVEDFSELGDYLASIMQRFNGNAVHASAPA
jgi:capsular polysaccharide transport system ATP-binding protein